ncbi:MAG: SRPBCC domain-containing protein [Alphaproteobacteria bacterium]|jgi:uncharacterized protein YndB with AHSA1/START domain
MSEEAQFAHAHMVRFEHLLPGPTERAWQMLTEASLLPGWYGEGHIEPRIGGTVTLMGGHIRGTVTQCLPPERLAYSWNVFNPGDEVSPYPESYLTLELKAAGGDTALTLTHLPVLERFVKLNAMGWHTYLDMVAAALRGEPVAPRDAYMTRNAKTYGIDLANPLG